MYIISLKNSITLGLLKPGKDEIDPVMILQNNYLPLLLTVWGKLVIRLYYVDASMLQFIPKSFRPWIVDAGRGDLARK